MNERIQELVEQAIIYIEPNSDHDGTWAFDKEKFAELVRADAIAKEREACAELCSEIDGGENMFSRAIRARGNT